MKIVILHQTIADRDAIGNDIYHMYNILKKNHECFIYCNYLLSDRFIAIDRNNLNEIISDKNNLIIYHHSIYWEEGEDILKEADAKLIFKYHNITPELFFENYYETYYRLCSSGREQTRRLNEGYRECLWMGASAYNLKDITAYRKAVVPPFNNVEGWNSITPDNKVLKSLVESNNINLLFVGRIAPNKGHKFLIKVVKDYIENYDSNICVNFIGKKDDSLRSYNVELTHLIDYYDLNDKVNFTGEVSDNVLLSYYLGSDFFVCCSEHEGFCIPIIEAQFTRLPVIARKAGAVEETLGLNQVVSENDVREYSAGIKVLTENIAYKEFVIENGFKNYRERFSNMKIAGIFKKTIENYMGISI